jgi:hypothetical protein
MPLTDEIGLVLGLALIGYQIWRARTLRRKEQVA